MKAQSHVSKTTLWIARILVLVMMLTFISPSVSMYAADGDTDTTITDEPFASDDPDAIPLESISLSKETAEIIKGKTLTLSVSFVPEETTDDKTVTWSSSNETVATVTSAGKVKALKAGTADITAACGECSAVCTVTVKEIKLSKITLSKKTLTIAEGASKTLKVTYSPSNTTDSKTIKWTSSNKKVATVTSKGKVTAKKKGTATITAKCGTKKATCKVTVKGIALKSIKLNKTKLTMDKGTSKTLKVTYTPSNTTHSKKITWSSSNKKVATVSSKGKVTAKNYGTATITAKCGTKKATCKITIKNGYENVSKGYTLLNDMRTGGKIWYWNEDNKTKTYFNTNSSNQLSALKKDAGLEKTAKLRAKELATYYAHVRPNGESCFTAYPNYLSWMGENIAYGFTTIEWVTEAWAEENDKYEGQGHRRNMLNPNFNVIGIACYQKDDVKYWVQCFGRK